METTIVKAVLDGIIFQNQQTHYIVGHFSETETYHIFTATGNIIDPQEDQEYELEGEYTIHPKYGKQFKILRANKILPTNEKAIIRFLSGHAFPTIGKKTAQQIYNSLGDRTLEKIKEDPQCLRNVSGLNASKIKVITEGIENFEGFSNTYAKLVQFGLDQTRIALLEKNYENVMDVLEENCFRPYYEIFGFGYKSACKIADGLKLQSNDPKRLDALIYETLRNLTLRSQDTYVHRIALFDELSHIDPTIITDSLLRLKSLESMHIDKEKIYPFHLFDEEAMIADSLALHSFEVEPMDQKQIDHKIKEVEFEDAITYDDTQKEAIHCFFQRSLILVNGGPGTGKTTIVKAILKMCRSLFPDSTVQLCAPTGRASKRLAQLSQYDSKTIHSLLKWNMEDNSFGLNHAEPLDIDFLIVDEFSMVDTHLFAHLLDALPAHCRILLIGDENQLESVGPGKVFKDLIDSQQFQIIHLKKIYRQLHGSGIVTLANEIRLDQNCTYEDGVHFIQENTPDILPRLLSIAQNYPQDAMQILAPMYQGGAGIDRVNHAMQQMINPLSSEKNEVRIGGTIFREHDKVMLLKNLPEQDVYNGDIGTIELIDKDINEFCISVDFGNAMVDFNTDVLYYLKHAWCISVHKSQGSEYPVVLCIVDGNARYMLNKRLLYTAVSRAKKQLFIIGQQVVFEQASKLRQLRIRQTTLKDKIIKKMEP